MINIAPCGAAFDTNDAANRLERPGEAIYNDANGLVEGNHFFQVVWLPDDRRIALVLSLLKPWPTLLLVYEDPAGAASAARPGCPPRTGRRPSGGPGAGDRG